ncbi:MAG: ABC transporter permease, partial [Candidatus Hodarchaeota archaeon]
LPILEGVDFNVSLHLDEVQCVGLNEGRFMVQVEVNRNVIGNWTLEDRDKIEFSDQLQVGGRNDIRLIFADISKFPVKLVINWSPITWIENSTPRQMKVNGTILTRGSKTGWKYLATNVRLLDNIFQMRYGLPPFSWNEAVTRYHILGTDKLGHDIVSGLLYGARVVFFVAILATIVSTLIGMFLGSIAGYFSGLVDDVLIRFSEFFIGLPRFILILFVFSFRNFLFSNLWESLIVIAFIIGSTSWSSVFRVVRGAFLSFNERKITSNLCTSRFHFWFLLKHLFLNELSVVIIINLAEVVLFGSALTFLGLGHTSAPDWGRMLELSVEGARFAWWAVLYPGFSLFFLVLTFHFIGESLRDILMNQQGEELEAALNI